MKKVFKSIQFKVKATLSLVKNSKVYFVKWICNDSRCSSGSWEKKVRLTCELRVIEGKQMSGAPLYNLGSFRPLTCAILPGGWAMLIKAHATKALTESAAFSSCPLCTFDAHIHFTRRKRIQMMRSRTATVADWQTRILVPGWRLKAKSWHRAFGLQLAQSELANKQVTHCHRHTSHHSEL